MRSNVPLLIRGHQKWSLERYYLDIEGSIILNSSSYRNFLRLWDLINTFSIITVCPGSSSSELAFEEVFLDVRSQCTSEPLTWNISMIEIYEARTFCDRVFLI